MSSIELTQKIIANLGNQETEDLILEKHAELEDDQLFILALKLLKNRKPSKATSHILYQRISAVQKIKKDDLKEFLISQESKICEKYGFNSLSDIVDLAKDTSVDSRNDAFRPLTNEPNNSFWRWDVLAQKFKNLGTFQIILILIIIAINYYYYPNSNIRDYTKLAHNAETLYMWNLLFGFIYLLSWPLWLYSVSKQIETD